MKMTLYYVVEEAQEYLSTVTYLAGPFGTYE